MQDIIEMPKWVEERHHELHLDARACYEMRDGASSELAAQDFHEIGDIYFLRALAITAEWEQS
jgi:hypothetical protein